MANSFPSQSGPDKFRCVLGCFLTLVFLSGDVAFGQTSGTWTGDGGNGSFNVPANWGGTLPIGGVATTLTFGATSGTNLLNNDLGVSSLTLQRLRFLSTSTNYAISGNAFEFVGASSEIVVSGTSQQNIAINNNLILNHLGGLNLEATGSALLTINGNINSLVNGAHALTLQGAGTVTVNGVISDNVSGTLALMKATTSTHYLTNTANSFSGSVTIGAGALVVSSLADQGANSALGKGNSIFLSSTVSTSVLLQGYRTITCDPNRTCSR